MVATKSRPAARAAAANRAGAAPRYGITVLSSQAGPVHATSGLRLVPDGTTADRAAGLLAVLVIALAVGAFDDPSGYLPWAVAAGLAGMVGLVCFYAALAAGTMGVVSPIAALGVVTLRAVVEGERAMQRSDEAFDRGELRAEIPFLFCTREPGEHEHSDLLLALAAKASRISSTSCFTRAGSGRSDA